MTPEGWAAYLHWRPEFAKAIDPRRYTMAYLDEMVSAGNFLFDCTDDAAILTEARSYPTGIWEVWGFCAAGNKTTIKDVLIPMAEKRAEAWGAAASIINSRPAWGRIMEGDGYEPYKVEIRKPLANEANGA